MSYLRRFMQWVNDHANPVVIKELRQAVQSRQVVAILMLFLLINTLAVSGYLITTPDASVSDRAGRQLFEPLFDVLALTCLVFVPLYTAVRLTMERNDSNIDLLFITTIAPGAIIRGKFSAAMALTALIFSASSPFLALTYLLRGIDLPSIFLALAFAFFQTALVTMLAIFVGALSGGWLLRVLMLVLLLLVGGWLTVLTLQVSSEWFVRGAAMISRFWDTVAVYLLVAGGCWGLAYLLAVASVSPRSSNRMFPIRVYVTIWWMLLGGVAAAYATLLSGFFQPIQVWALPTIVIASLILCLSLAERESWSPRVRRKIPRNTLARFWAWVFYTGSAGGVIWCALIGIITALCCYTFTKIKFGPYGAPLSNTELMNVIVFFLYAWCYSMSGLFVRRMVVPRSAPLVGTALAMLLVGLGGTLPLLVAFLTQGAFWRFDTLPLGFMLGNPMVIARRWPEADYVFIFLELWAVFGLLVNLPWFQEQWHQFLRYEPKPLPGSAPIAEEPPVVHA